MNEKVHLKPDISAHPSPQKEGLFARQRLSTLGKVAFWTLVFSTLACLGIAITLTIFNGSPSRDIVIVTILLLVTTLLVGSGIRVLQALAILPSICTLYMLFTEPFVIEALADPKGPNGGYGHFIGDLQIMGAYIVGFVALVTTVVQDLRRERRRVPSWFSSVVCAALGLVIGASFIGALATPASASSNTLTYTNGVPTLHLSAGSFDLSTITINKGSKLLVIDDTTSQHVLANGTWQNKTPILKREAGAPLVNNISLSGNSATLGPFNIAGTYHILCLVHPGMNLTITVQ